MHRSILSQTELTEPIVFKAEPILFEIDGLFSLSVVLSSSFVRIERFYCSIYIEPIVFEAEPILFELDGLFSQLYCLHLLYELKRFIVVFFQHGPERCLLSIPRQGFHVLNYSCPIVRIVKCSCNIKEYCVETKE